MKRRVLYMHTLDDRPATYWEAHGDRGIGYPTLRQGVQLVASLRQLRAEQQKVKLHEERAAYPGFRSGRRYGYVRVEVPE